MPVLEQMDRMIEVRLVAVACELGLPDALAHGPRTAADLAGAGGLDADAAFRVLRYLTSKGWFRVEGGGPLARHKNIQLTLYAMFERVETARAYSRAALNHTQANLPGASPEALGASPRHARAAQVFAKRAAYEVAHDALQVFGAQGLSRDFAHREAVPGCPEPAHRGRHP